MAILSSAARGNLPDSAFAFIEEGGKKVNGKTTPGSLRHFPIHDAAHVRNALARIGQGARFGDQAKAKVLAAAKKFGVEHDSGSETGRSLESLYPEMRFIADQPGLEFRDHNGDSVPHITGLAAAFGKLSRRLGGFVERVDTRAFDAAAADNFPGVVCRYNHRDDMVLGTTAAGTLTLEIDERGLRYDVNPPRSRGDVLELVQRGDVRYSSFAFRCNEPGIDDEWGVSDFNYPMRTLHKVELVDVAPVLDPAYFDTSAAARNMIGAVESLARWVDAEPDEVRSYLAAGQALKFFKKTGNGSTVPEVSKDAAETRVLDDTAVALRNWKYDPDAPTEAELEEAEEEAPAEEQNSRPTQDEIRAALKSADQLCKQWVAGEPCVRPAGHKDEHEPLCWGRKDGLPCGKPMGHDDEHEPISVKSRDAEDAEDTQNTESRDETSSEEETRAAEEVPDFSAEMFAAQAAMDELRAQIAAEELS